MMCKMRRGFEVSWLCRRRADRYPCGLKDWLIRGDVVLWGLELDLLFLCCVHGGGQEGCEWRDVEVLSGSRFGLRGDFDWGV